MKILSKISYFLFASNLLVAFSGAVLTFGVGHLFSIANSEKYAFITFCLILGVYTLQRYVDQHDFEKSESEIWGESSKIPLFIGLVSLLLALIVGWPIFHFSWTQAGLIFLFSLISLWYTVPIFGVQLRLIPGVKIFMIAATWIYACAIFPAMNEGVNETNEIAREGGLLLLFLIGVTLPFDIRDKSIDNQRQSTFPQLIGNVYTKIFGLALLLLFWGMSIYFQTIEWNNWLFHFSVFLQVIFLLCATEKRPYYYFLLIDGGITFLGLSYLV